VVLVFAEPFDKPGEGFEKRDLVVLKLGAGLRPELDHETGAAKLGGL
jgi:hypothetical protein